MQYVILLIIIIIIFLTLTSGTNVKWWCGWKIESYTINALSSVVRVFLIIAKIWIVEPGTQGLFFLPFEIYNLRRMLGRWCTQCRSSALTMLNAAQSSTDTSYLFRATSRDGGTVPTHCFYSRKYCSWSNCLVKEWIFISSVQLDHCLERWPA